MHVYPPSPSKKSANINYVPVKLFMFNQVTSERFIVRAPKIIYYKKIHLLINLIIFILIS